MKRILTLAAVVVALAVTATAGAAADHWLLPDDSVKSRHIVPETIRARDIASEGVSWRTLGWRVQSHLDPQIMVFRYPGARDDGHPTPDVTMRCVADREARRDFVFECIDYDAIEKPPPDEAETFRLARKLFG